MCWFLISAAGYKNSSGIKLLVTLITRVDAAGQRLFAVQINEDYRNVLLVTGLNEGMTIYASEADAVQAAHDLLDTPAIPGPRGITPRARPISGEQASHR